MCIGYLRRSLRWWPGFGSGRFCCVDWSNIVTVVFTRDILWLYVVSGCRSTRSSDEAVTKWTLTICCRCLSARSGLVMKNQVRLSHSVCDKSLNLTCSIFKTDESWVCLYCCPCVIRLNNCYPEWPIFSRLIELSGRSYFTNSFTKVNMD